MNTFTRPDCALAATVKKGLLSLALLGGLSISSGCTSVRSTVNLNPPQDITAFSEHYQFRLERLQYAEKDDSDVVSSLPHTPPGPGERPAGLPATYTWNEAKWFAEVKRTGESRYPSLFTTGRGAYPLSVSIRVAGRATGPGTMILSFLLSGMRILPQPYSETIEFEVCPVLSLDNGTTRVPLATVEFQRKDVMWLSTTPLGLIPVPGRADQRFVHLGFFPGSPLSPDLTTHYTFNVESCVDAIVLALQSSEEDIRNALTGGASGIGTVAP